MKNEKGQKYKSLTTRYSLIAIGKDGTVHKHSYTQCNNHRRNRNLNVCSLHSTSYFSLEESLLNEINTICKKFIKLIDFEKITKDKQKNLNTYGTTLLQKKPSENPFHAEQHHRLELGITDDSQIVEIQIATHSGIECHLSPVIFGKIVSAIDAGFQKMFRPVPSP